MPQCRAAASVSEGSRAYGLGALRRELQRLSQARQGTRNHQLNTASFNIGRLVAAGAICEQEAAAALIEQGQRIWLGATACERTVASGRSAGMKHRGESRSVTRSFALWSSGAKQSDQKAQWSC
jgi:hypothetical protein